MVIFHSYVNVYQRINSWWLLASIEFTAIGLFPVMGEVNMHHILADNDALLTFWQESFQVQVALGRPWNGTVKCQKPPFFVLMIYTNMAKLGMVDPIAFRIAESCYTMPRSCCTMDIPRRQWRKSCPSCSGLSGMCGLRNGSKNWLVLTSKKWRSHQQNRGI